MAFDPEYFKKALAEKGFDYRYCKATGTHFISQADNRFSAQIPSFEIREELAVTMFIVGYNCGYDIALTNFKNMSDNKLEAEKALKEIEDEELGLDDDDLKFLGELEEDIKESNNE